MEEEDEGGEGEIETLFDFYWFRHLILRPNPPPPPSPPPQPPSEPEDAESHTSDPPPVARPRLLLRRHWRSLSDELAPSESLRIQPPRLQTILSGKESAAGEEIERFEVAGSGGGGGERRWRRGRSPSRRKRRRRRSGKSSKSLSDPEYEEVKGFMDLGFSFSEAESDPRLLSIVPGLQRLRVAGDGEAAASAEELTGESDAAGEPFVSRPYLSEAWDAEEEEDPLRNWRIPAVEDGVDLKDHLRYWAHAVASAVR